MNKPMWLRYLLMVGGTVLGLGVVSLFAGWRTERLGSLLWILLLKTVLFGLFVLLMRRGSGPRRSPIPGPTGAGPTPSDPQ